MDKIRGDPKITGKQKKFADEYIKTLNGRKSYKVAYGDKVKDNTADTNAVKLLSNTKVKEYIRQEQLKIQERTEITEDMIIRELALIAFTDRTKFFKVIEKIKIVGNDEIGYEEIKYNTTEITKTEDLKENERKVISGIKEGKNGIEVELCDKMKALELLGKHLGIFKDKVELTGKMEINLENITKLSDEELRKLAEP